jgi:hypothetical protein
MEKNISCLILLPTFLFHVILVNEILYSKTEVVYNKTQQDCKLFPKETIIYRIIDSRPKFD